MTFDEYQRLAARTMNPDLTEEQTERHALLLLASEVGEIHGLYQKELQGHQLTAEDVMEEAGDTMWALAELCTINGWTLSEVAERNIEKLKRRYKVGFSVEESIRRIDHDSPQH